MSKGIKTIARIALPIAGTVIGGMFGMPQIGGMIGGAIGGGMGGGGLGGAAMGALGGYMGAGTVKSVIGSPMQSINFTRAAPGFATGTQVLPGSGSGIMGALTGGGVRALAAPLTQAAGGGLMDDPSKLLMLAGNQMVASEGSDAAIKAARIQAGAADRGIAATREAQQQQQQTLQPFVNVGTTAASRLNTIQSDPASYIQNNPLYTSLASDAQRRLLANQAAKGKVGSGGTATALQEQLLNIGTGLVNQEVSNLQNQINTGQNAAVGVGSGQLLTGGNVADLYTSQGAARAAGQVGSYGAQQQGYQNQINTLLALQALQRAPVYQPMNV